MENEERSAEVEQPTQPVQRVETKEALISDLRTLLQGELDGAKERVDQIKNHFYRLCQQEQDLLNKQKEESGEEVETEPIVDALEHEFRELLSIYKQRRAEQVAARNAELEQNLLRKQSIIAQMKLLAECETADVQTNIQQFKQLQADWKNIGPVPATDSADVWKQYNLYQEQFYDLVKINNELRDYDFKKNLEQKTHLCELAEKLLENESIIESSRALQQLHEQWAEIGPVARELREELWTRFKEASTAVNKRHQEYFDQLHAKEEENLQKKKALIERLRAIDLSSLSTSQLFMDATKQVQNIQNEWKTIGFAPKKMNQKIYDEYREVCEQFFAAKASFFKSLHGQQDENLALKLDLVEKAEALTNSQEWKKSAEAYVQIQKDWKKIGAVPHKYSDVIWKRFTAACDHFFEAKKAANQSQFVAEKENFAAKKNIVDQLEQLPLADAEVALSKVRELCAQYAEIGYVPIKEKDVLQKRYRAAVDRIYDQLHVDARAHRINSFAKHIETKDGNELERERRRLVRQMEALQQEIKTAENNILFFKARTNKSSGIIDDMQKKITRQQEQLAELKDEIKALEDKL